MDKNKQRLHNFATDNPEGIIEGILWLFSSLFGGDDNE